MKTRQMLHRGLMVVAMGAGIGTLAAGANASSFEAGLLVLSPSDQSALRLSGGGTIISQTVRVNSIDVKALDSTGGSMLDVQNVYVAGGANIGPENHTGDVHTSATVTADPYADVAPPAWDIANDLGTVAVNDGIVSAGPGYYSGGIRISGGAVKLSPGVYVLDGEGVVLSGGGSITGNGVVLYIKGTGRISLSGGSTIALSPAITGPYAGLTIFQDVTNTNDLTFSGGAEFQVAGTLYAPAPHMRLTGNSEVESEGPLFGKLLIAKTVEVSGTGLIQIGYRQTLPDPILLYD